MSHGTQDEHAETIKRAKAAAKKLDRPLAILVDLSGPKIRTGLLQNAKPVMLEAEAEFVITSRDIEGNMHEVSTNFKEIPKLVKKGDKVLLDDGAIELEVKKVSKPMSRRALSTAAFCPNAKALICRIPNCRFRL